MGGIALRAHAHGACGPRDQARRRPRPAAPRARERGGNRDGARLGGDDQVNTALAVFHVKVGAVPLAPLVGITTGHGRVQEDQGVHASSLEQAIDSSRSRKGMGVASRTAVLSDPPTIATTPIRRALAYPCLRTAVGCSR